MVAKNFSPPFCKKKLFWVERLEEDCIKKKRNLVFSAAKKFPFLGASESSEEIKSLTWSWNLMIGFEIPFDIILHISEAGAAGDDVRW